MSADADADADGAAIDAADLPEWDDEYLNRIAGRLAANYDLERGYEAGGERFDLYGKLDVHSHKQFFHPALSYAHHEMEEHLLADRVDPVRVDDLETLVALGHDLAETWVTPDDSHFSTDFSFVLVTNSIPESVREFVAGFSDRTLLDYGYHGHYEINLAVVSPRREDYVASENADVAAAFVPWEALEGAQPGFVVRLLRGVFG